MKMYNIWFAIILSKPVLIKWLFLKLNVSFIWHIENKWVYIIRFFEERKLNFVTYCGNIAMERLH